MTTGGCGAAVSAIGSAAEATAVAPAAEGVVEGTQEGAAGFSLSAFMLLVSIPGGIPLTAEQQCVESGSIGQMLHHRGDSKRGPVNIGVATSGMCYLMYSR